MAGDENNINDSGKEDDMVQSRVVGLDMLETLLPSRYSYEKRASRARVCHDIRQQTNRTPRSEEFPTCSRQRGGSVRLRCATWRHRPVV